MHDVYEQNGMKIKVFIVGMVSTNCFVVSNVTTKQAFVIDPGDDEDMIIKYLDEEKLSVEGVLLTHGHFDHIYGAESISKKYGVPLYAHETEAALLKDPTKNASQMVGRVISLSGVTTIKDDEILNIGGFELKVIHTPGHTAGSVCFYCDKTNVLFSGDTLFQESVGRTDFPTGSGSQIIRSIREKLAVLPDDTTVFPGHGPATTIRYEKANNPYIGGLDMI